MNGRRVLADFIVFARSYIRSPVGLFFSLIFPVILIFLFGLIFSGSGSTVTLYTLNLDHNSPLSVEYLQALNETGVVTVQVENSNIGAANFSSWLAQNSNPVGLVIPAGFNESFAAHTPVNLTLYVDPQDPSSSGTAEGAVTGVSNGFNLRAANGTEVITYSTYNVGSQVFKYIDYLVPGLIGFTILTSPMFAIVDITSSYRKDHIFRQLSLTPLTRGEWLTAKIIWYVILSFLSAVIMITVGTTVFGAHLTVSPGLIGFLVAGPILFVALGMLLGSVAKTPESAAVAANAITFPMMFLAGTFFPVSEFPPFLQVVARVLPLYYVISGMNQVMLFGNLPLALLDLLVVVALALIFFVAAIRIFKWRDD